MSLRLKRLANALLYQSTKADKPRSVQYEGPAPNARDTQVHDAISGCGAVREDHGPSITAESQNTYGFNPESAG